jgi:hypothetical protein
MAGLSMTTTSAAVSQQQALAAYRSGKQSSTTSASDNDFANIDPKLVASSRAAAQDFEAFFITSSFSEMSSDLQPDSMFGGGEGESIFQSMLNNEYGKLAAQTQGVGIADQVQRELLHLQERPRNE